MSTTLEFTVELDTERDTWHMYRHGLLKTHLGDEDTAQAAIGELMDQFAPDYWPKGACILLAITFPDNAQ